MSNSITYDLIENQTINILIEDNSIWATQKQMAQLFAVDVSVITKHLKNIFESHELDKNSVCAKFAHTANDGKAYNTNHYHLDAIISVGYRVNSTQATKFRIWATKILNQYIKDGYVINEVLLKNNPDKLTQLSAKIRELRASEQNIFAKVRECFKISASDYQPNSQEVRNFYSLLQDKFHYAITRMTASKLIMDRADSKKEKMGLVTIQSNNYIPTKQEIKIGKNYLTENELYRMYLLSEQFLLYAESQALQAKLLTMKDLHTYLDKLLEFNEYPVFSEYKDNIRAIADEHVEMEYDRFIKIKKLEMLGVDVDFVEFDNGAYQHYQQELDDISIQKLKQYFNDIPKQIS